MGALNPKTLMRACLSPKHASSIQHFWAFSFPMTQDMSRAAVQGRTKSVRQDWAPSYYSQYKIVWSPRETCWVQPVK